jgi:molybdopterin molybdotransferase
VLITVAEARKRVLAHTPRLGEESVSLDMALDRVLARDVLAAGDLPPFTCSAMDGYALAPGPAGRVLTVIGESRSGTPGERSPRDGEAIRISTGAVVPAGPTAVIRQEDVDALGSEIRTRAASSAGDNIRHAGQDQQLGSTVLRSGTTLGAAALGAAVDAGAAALFVARKPRVAVLCTGDELRAPGEPLGPGQIHNSNGLMLAALATQSGASAEPALHLRDDLATIESALAPALARCDVVVLSGGVSVGPHDHVKAALAALGVAEVFWGVALKPGKPSWFGTLDHKLVFGLPGNPVSAFVTFALFAAPALAALQGVDVPQKIGLEATLGISVLGNLDREQALPVKLERRDGCTIALPIGDRRRHLLGSLLIADAIALIPRSNGELKTGTSVPVIELPR